jgi:hypothetical protein
MSDDLFFPFIATLIVNYKYCKQVKVFIAASIERNQCNTYLITKSVLSISLQLFQYLNLSFT